MNHGDSGEINSSQTACSIAKNFCQNCGTLEGSSTVSETQVDQALTNVTVRRSLQYYSTMTIEVSVVSRF